MAVKPTEQINPDGHPSSPGQTTTFASALPGIDIAPPVTANNVPAVHTPPPTPAAGATNQTTNAGPRAPSVAMQGNNVAPTVDPTTGDALFAAGIGIAAPVIASETLTLAQRAARAAPAPSAQRQAQAPAPTVETGRPNTNTQQANMANAPLEMQPPVQGPTGMVVQQQAPKIQPTETAGLRPPSVAFNLGPQDRVAQSTQLMDMMHINNPQTRQQMMSTLDHMSPASFKAFETQMQVGYAPVQNSTGSLGKAAQNKAFGAAMNAAYHAAPTVAEGTAVAASLSVAKAQIDSDHKGPKADFAGGPSPNANKQQAFNNDGGGAGGSGSPANKAQNGAPKPGQQATNDKQKGQGNGPRPVTDHTLATRVSFVDPKTGETVYGTRFDQDKHDINNPTQSHKSSFIAVDTNPHAKTTAKSEQGMRINNGQMHAMTPNKPHHALLKNTFGIAEAKPVTPTPTASQKTVIAGHSGSVQGAAFSGGIRMSLG